MQDHKLKGFLNMKQEGSSNPLCVFMCVSACVCMCVCFNTSMKIKSLLGSQEHDPYFLEQCAEV
jgi:hypothetical protein